MPLLSPQEATDQLVRLEDALVRARAELRADPATRFRSPRTSAPPGTMRLGLLGAVVFFAVLVAVFGVVEGSPIAVVVAVAVGAAAVATAVVVLRRTTLPADRASRAASRVPRDRQRALLDQVDEVYAGLGGRLPAPSLRPIALPRSRQPTLWVQTMHGRYGVGDDPVDVLRRLPPDAATSVVWFHRTLGWSALAALALALVVVLVGSVVLVLRIRADV